MGEEIVVGAKIYNMTGFSAHADKHQMMDLYVQNTKNHRILLLA